MHAADDFLRAIEAEPGDRTRRLVFADWLDERSDPRGELIRVEEEMRTLPVFADRFWELKPRRNELRAAAGPEWCGRMRHGTECEPVFRHGIPDGWRERWRLIREFTERWHRVPMPDVGGRQNEIAEAEARLGRTLPPSLREWLAVECDMREHRPPPFWGLSLEPIPGRPALSLLLGEDEEVLSAVLDADLRQPDPPVYRCARDGTLTSGSGVLGGSGPGSNSVSATVLHYLLIAPSGYDHFSTEFLSGDSQREAFVTAVEEQFPVHVQFGSIDLYERENATVAFEPGRTERQKTVYVRIASQVPPESLSPFLQGFFHWPSMDEPIPF